MDANTEDAEHLEKRLVIRINANTKMSRGKAAAHAVHAALKLYGIDHHHPVIVIVESPTRSSPRPCTCAMPAAPSSNPER